jgi:hypothetical protein
MAGQSPYAHPLFQLLSMGNIFVKMSETARLMEYDYLLKSNKLPIGPKYWAMRFDHILSPDKQQRIQDRWDMSMAVKPKACVNNPDEGRLD